MIKLRMKECFFDRPAVMRAVAAGERKALSKAGAFIRTRAKSSIRKRKTEAQPGEPPHSHVGLLKKLIYFGYDASSHSVVVGPERIGTTDAPHTLEFGGMATAQYDYVLRVGYGRSRKRRLREGASSVKIRKGDRLRYAPHPFMGPALEAELGHLPPAWANLWA